MDQDNLKKETYDERELSCDLPSTLDTWKAAFEWLFYIIGQVTCKDQERW